MADRELRAVDDVKRDLDAAAEELERAGLTVSAAILAGVPDLTVLRNAHRNAALAYARAAKRIFREAD